MADAPQRWLPHGQAKVWRALTEPGSVARWLPFEGFTAEPGHRFVAHGPEGRVDCEVVEVEAPSRLVLSWGHLGEQASRVVLRLVSELGGTRVVAEHEGVPAAVEADLLALWSQALGEPLHEALTPVAPVSSWVGSTGMWVAIAAASAMIAGAVATASSWSPRRPDRFTPSEGEPVVSASTGRSGPALPTLPPGSDTFDGLRVYEDELPTTLHPLYPRTEADYRTHTLVFDRLFFGSGDTISSRLVASHEPVGELLKITLHPGLAFHDGHELTAADVCFSVDAALQPAHGSTLPFRERGDLLGCDVISHRKAVLRFRLPFHDAPARADVPILPAHLFTGTLTPDDPFAEQPVGSGPYRAQRERRRLRFVATASAQHDAKVPLITMEDGGDPMVQMKVRHAGNVEGLVVAHAGTRPDLAADGETALVRFDTRTVVYAAVSPRLPLATRQAIAGALSRAELIERGLRQGEGPVPLSGPWLSSSRLNDPSVVVSQGAPARSAGSLVVASDPWLAAQLPSLTTVLSEQLRAAGFEVELVRADSPQAGSHDLWLGRHTYGLYEDPTALLSPTVLGGRSEGADAALRAYRDATDAATVQAAGRALHRVVVDDKLVLPLFEEPMMSAWSAEVQGVVISPGTYWAYIDDWSRGERQGGPGSVGAPGEE